MQFSWRPPVITNYAIKAPPPILYTCHHKIPPFQQLPKKKFLKETEKNNNKNNGKQRGKGMGEVLFFSLPSALPFAPLCKRVAHRVANVVLSTEILLCCF